MNQLIQINTSAAGIKTVNARDLHAFLEVGRIATQYGLKTPEHGEFRLNKATGHDKQIESFYYNERGIKAVSQVIEQLGEAA